MVIVLDNSASCSSASSTGSTWSVSGPTPSQANFLNAQAGGFTDTAMSSTVNPFTGTYEKCSYIFLKNLHNMNLVCRNQIYRHLIILVFCHFLGTNANSWVSSGSNGIPNSSNPPSGFGANPFRSRPGQPGFGMNSGKKVP
jgi:hypothetical protein